MPSLSVLSDWLLYIIGAIGSGVIGLSAYVQQIDKRSRQNKRRLVGDEDDPNNEGVLQIARDNNRKIDCLEDRMTEQHKQLMRKVEEMVGD